MRKRMMAMALICATFLVFGAVPFASAYQFSLEASGGTDYSPGDEIQLNIVLDDGTGVAGCAFTLNYDTEVLEPPSEIQSSSFLFTWNDGTGLQMEETHRENFATGTINIIGANIGTDGGSPFASGAVVLFSVIFKVKETAAAGSSFSITLTQTRINNITAGYEDEYKPALVGAVNQSDPNWNNLGSAFPVLLDDPGIVTFSGNIVNPAFAVNGTVNYSGSRTGDLYVTAYSDPDLTTTVQERTFTWTSGMVSQNFSFELGDGTYYIFAYIDDDASGSPETLDPQVQLDPITISGSDYSETLLANLDSFTIDIDGNGQAEALRDGILLLRYLMEYNLVDPDWISGAYDPNGSRTTTDAIETYISDNLTYLDIDGNGTTEALRDGILVIRYLLENHLVDPNWIYGAYDAAGTRNTGPLIEAYMEDMMP